MIHDFVPAVTWQHFDGCGETHDGVRVVHSMDVPGAMSIQISHDGRVLTARMTPELIGELHRQAMTG